LEINEDYRCIKDIKAHEEGVRSLLELREGCFASGSLDCKIKIWDMCGYQCINVLEGHRDKVTSLLFLKDNRIVSASADKSIILWNY
jgi:WD40 repeat protein